MSVDLTLLRNDHFPSFAYDTLLDNTVDHSSHDIICQSLSGDMFRYSINTPQLILLDSHMDSSALPTTLEAVEAYVLARTSLATSSLNVDIRPPKHGETAYASESGSDYVGVLFGEITEINVRTYSTLAY
jgi:hypothetical protein